MHLDVVVDGMDGALAQAVGAGARAGRDVRVEVWGKIAGLADPFGHRPCLIEFLNRGHGEVAVEDHTLKRNSSTSPSRTT